MSPDPPAPVFVVGCARSGTTVTYEKAGYEALILIFPRNIAAFHAALDPWSHDSSISGWDFTA
jgi:hypothetical protein